MNAIVLAQMVAGLVDIYIGALIFVACATVVSVVITLLMKWWQGPDW